MPPRTVNHDHPGDTTQPRVAGLLIEIFPIDEPPGMGMAIHNAGPAPLSQDEAVRAAEELDVSATWRG